MYDSIVGWRVATYDQYAQKKAWQSASGNVDRKEIGLMGDNGICFALSLLWSNEILKKSMFTTRTGRMAALSYTKAREVFQRTMGIDPDDPLSAFLGEDIGGLGGGGTQVATVIQFDTIKTYVPNILTANLVEDTTHWDLGTFLARVLTSSTVRKTPMMLNFIGNGYGHSVGVYRSSGGHVYLFEPNAGEYMIPTLVLDSFFDKWIKDSNKAFGKPEADPINGYKLIELLGAIR